MILCKERKRPQVQGKMNCEVEKEKCLGSKLRRRKSSGKPVSCKLASTSALAAERNPPPCLFSGQNGNLNKEKTQLLRKSLNVDRKILCKMSSRLIWWICNWNYLHGLLCIYIYICKCYIWLYNLYSVFVFEDEEQRGEQGLYFTLEAPACPILWVRFQICFIHSPPLYKLYIEPWFRQPQNSRIMTLNESTLMYMKPLMALKISSKS